MRVADLIAQLQQLPPDARVVVHAGEKGFLDIDGAQVVPIIADAGREIWRHFPHHGVHKLPVRHKGESATETAVLIAPEGGNPDADEDAFWEMVNDSR